MGVPGRRALTVEPSKWTGITSRPSSLLRGGQFAAAKRLKLDHATVSRIAELETATSGGLPDLARSDTNVVSEAMKPEPAPPVRQWLDAQAAERLYLSTVTIAELLFWGRRPQEGKRKVRLTAAVEGVIGLFADRILPFDAGAARRHADHAVKARSAGRGFPTPDGYIAATAASRGFAVASRDTSVFAAVGLRVIDPWTAGA